LILLLLVGVLSAAGQTKAKLKPSSRIESREGNHPEGPRRLHQCDQAGSQVEKLRSLRPRACGE
jgi:hypothetical protein